MDFTVKKVYDTVLNLHMIEKGDRILVGLSGGADSVFLILSLMEIQKYVEFELYAAHLNHGIRGHEAKRDEDFVAEFCKKHSINLFAKTVNIPEIAKASKISEETAGRNERYSFFYEITKKYDINKIAVAHNKNDSVETIIFNMIRGASLNGLCGIKPINGSIIRPIIEISREEIEIYLKNINQDFCIDSTNLCDIYTRNKIRNNILNSMKQINTSVVDTIYSNSKNISDDSDFINSYCIKLNCITDKSEEIIINKVIFDNQHIAVKKRILFMAYEKINGSINNISGAHIDVLCRATEAGKTYNLPNGIFATISYNEIIFSKKQKYLQEFNYALIPGMSVEYIKDSYLTCNYCSLADFTDKNSIYIDADKLMSDGLRVRNRQDGDRFVPYGMKNHRKLKDFLIDLKIPVNERDEIPIVTDGERIVALVPYRISDLYKITNETKNILKITKEI